MALQHLRSSTANKRPLPAGMSDGQLAINTNAASPGLFFKDSSGNLVKTGPVHVGTTAPNASPASGGATGNSTGELWLDTSVSPNQLKTWNGSAWVSDFPDEIPVAKLADGAARQLLQTDAAGTGVEWTSNVDVPGTLDVTSTATFDSIASHPLGSAGAPTITFTGDTNTGIYSPGADQLALSTNGTGRLFVDASGNVGIGTASASGLFHVANTGTAGTTADNLSVFFSSANRNATVNIIAKNTESSILNLGDGESSSVGRIVYGHTSNYMAFDVNASERLRITSAGLVGIGASLPSTLLHIASSTKPVFRIDNTNTALTNGADIGSVDWYINDASSGGTGVGGEIALVGDGTMAGGGVATRMEFRTYNATSLNTGLTINKDGRVGIGTTGPQDALHIAVPSAVLRLEDTDTNHISTIQSTAAALVLSADATNSVASSYLGLSVDGSERARIDSSGRLLIGTSTSTGAYYDAASDWQGRFQVARSDQNAVASFSIWNSAASTYTNYGGVQLHLSACRSGTVGSHTSGALSSGDTIGSITFDASDGTNFRNSARIEAVVDGGVSTGDVPGRLVFSVTSDGASSPTERVRISNSGQLSSIATLGIGHRIGHVQGAGTSYPLIQGGYSASDIANMTTSFYVWTNGNVQNSNNSYTGISDIKLKENIVDASSQWDDIKALQVRNYNFKEGQTHTQIGLIAQEVELVSPGLVSESPDRDAEGNDLGTVTKSVNYSVLYMKAVKALQEAMERIEVLEQRLTDAGIA